VDPLGQLDGIGVELLEHGEDDSRFAIDPRFAGANRRRAELHPRHVSEADGTYRVRLDHRVAQLLAGAHEAADGDHRSLVADGEESTGDAQVRALDRVRDVGQRHLVRAQLLGVDDGLQLARRSPRGDHLGHAGDRHQTVLDVVVGERTKFVRMRGPVF